MSQMQAPGLDPQLTFESYVVGTSNRLAAAAAKRVAETPGKAYNPFFIYSASGLGKTHLMTAMGNHMRRIMPDLVVVYDTLEHMMDEVMEAIQAGERDAFRTRVRDAGVLLLDDVQFLAGRRGAQEELRRAWDVLASRGGQIVLASDRPPGDIDALDERLLSRFSGGLIVDVAVPDYETRVAIVRKKAEERGQALSDGVAEVLARVGFGNVRELQGGLNRVLAIQELEGRIVTAKDVERLVGAPVANVVGDEFGHFLSEVTGTLTELVSHVTPEQKVGDAILRWEGEGYQTRRLESSLGQSLSSEAVDSLIDQFEADIAGLGAVADEIRRLDAAASELGRLDVLRNPDRLDEAGILLQQVRERMRPLPGPAAGPTFRELHLDAELLAVRAARAVAQQPGDRYNPLFIHGPDASIRTALATALALLFQERNPEAVVAFITGEGFSGELIGAIKNNHVDAWRTRYRRARLLVVDGVDALMETERAQEELFHLFDDARRGGVQLVFTAPCPPRDLSGFEDRLRTRLESGLIVDLLPSPVDATLIAELDAAATATKRSAESEQLDEFFLDRGKVLWHWPYVQDAVVQALE